MRRVGEFAGRAVDVCFAAPFILLTVGWMVMVLPLLFLASLRFGAEKTFDPAAAAFNGATLALTELARKRAKGANKVPIDGMAMDDWTDQLDEADPANWWKRGKDEGEDA